MKSLFVIFLFAFTAGTAQLPCKPDSLANRKGVWKKKADEISGATDYGFPRAQVPALLKSMDNYISVIKQLYPELRGITGEWHKNIASEPVVPNGPQPNYVIAYISRFLCDGDKIITDLGSSSQINIESNYFFSMLGKTSWRWKGKEIFSMPNQIGQLQGHPYFEPPYDAAFGGDLHIYHRTVLLTKAGLSPFKILTRGDVLDYLHYLVDSAKALDRELINNMYPVRPEEEQKAEKQKEIGNYKKNYADHPRILERYLEDYRTDQQIKEAAFQKSDAAFQKRYDRISLLYLKYKSTLDSPAVVMDIDPLFNNDWDFAPDKMKEYIPNTETMNFGHELAVINDSYFNKKLPRGVPQFITVTFSWAAKVKDGYRNPFYEKLLDNWKKYFQFEKLQELIGK